MNNIVIVEDKLRRGISLAEQFAALSKEHPEYEIEVSDICYFCPKAEKAEKMIQNVGECQFNIKPINLLNFSETLDQYMNSPDSRALIIMDYVLEDDGSAGIPIRRVNIRYARNGERYNTNQLWFYTGTGILNQQILGELVGKKHVFDVLEVDDDYLRLDLNNMSFIEVLTAKQVTEV